MRETKIKRKVRGNHYERDNLRNIGLDGRIILK
jgi:hypothetical protein